MSLNEKDVSIEGLDELIKAFAALGDESLPLIKDAVNDAGEVVLRRAKEKVPVKTGVTKSQLKLQKARISKKATHKIIATIKAGKGAAPLAPLELGHRLFFMGHKTNRDVAARPFLRPAADESKNEVAGIIADAMNKALKEWGDGG